MTDHIDPAGQRGGSHRAALAAPELALNAAEQAFADRTMKGAPSVFTSAPAPAGAGRIDIGRPHP